MRQNLRGDPQIYHHQGCQGPPGSNKLYNAKRLNCEIEYSHRIRTVQYLVLYIVESPRTAVQP